jgi:4-amino-4-deoxychorismate lyase
MTSEPDFQLFSTLRYDPLLHSVRINTEQWDGDAPPSCPFYMLAFHRDRMLQAAGHFGWTEAASKINGSVGLNSLLNKLEVSIGVQSALPFRVKVLLDHHGDITVEHNPLPPVSEFNLYPHRIPPPQTAEKMKVSPLTGGALTLGPGDTVHGDPEAGDVWIVVPDTIKTKPSSYTTYKTTRRNMYMDARERVGIKDFGEKKEVLILSDDDGAVMEGSLTSVFFWRNGKWTTPPVASGGQEGTTRRWMLERKLCVEGVITADELIDGEECWISNGARGFNVGKVKL